MDEENRPEDVVGDGASDVMAEEEVVHVPLGAEELADSHESGSTFLPDVPGWDKPDEEPPVPGAA